MADLTTLQARLAEAEDAYHRLTVLKVEVSIEFDGHKTTFAVYDASIQRLERYISDLKTQIARLTNPGHRVRRTLRPRFF